MLKRLSLILLLCLAGMFAWAADAQVATITNPIDSAEMVLVPAGEFLMGSKDGEGNDDERSQHKVQLDAYYIYKNEVTVAQYRKFCTATGYPMPTEPAWNWQDNQPIANVSWDDAKAYAGWAGATLPTEAQWEKASRGIDGKVYPWGNTWDASKARSSVKSFADTQQPAAVGSYPAGASPYGCLDMAGNVWEWCSDFYTSDYYLNSPTVNPTGPMQGSTRVLRGGSWGDYDPGNFRSSFRPSREPSSRYNDCGFRCVTVRAPMINPKDNAVMVWVPGATFTMGKTDEKRIDEYPVHQVTLSGYWIYQYDVTVAQYIAFCTATDRALPEKPDGLSWFRIGLINPLMRQHPILNVTWFDAKAYADWAGVTLPTEAQWEYAAKGPQGRNYPWGGTATKGDEYNGWDATKCANRENSANVDKSTWPVGSFPAGASWCGAQDMTGNAVQWCSDWYGAYAATAVTDPTGPQTGNSRVRRGDSWNGEAFGCRNSIRSNYNPDFSGFDVTGFRCASTLTEHAPAITPTKPSITITAPTIVAIAPSSAIVGAVVTITGTYLDKVTAVTFNGIAAKTITDNTATSVKVTVPEGATSGKLSVTSASGTVTSVDDFIVYLGLKTNVKDGSEMVWVPGGTFTMGNAVGYGEEREHPAHQVTLDGYWIFQYDVTVAQYRDFCTATGHELPQFPSRNSWEGKTGWDDPALQQHPIVNVSWNDAKAYADWASVTLPTEAQWEYAARGPRGYNYPWGGTISKNDSTNGWDATKCASHSNSYSVGKSTWPVGSFPAGASWCGAQDMAGNVWQWCGDWYGDYSAATVTNPTGPVKGNGRVLRGGSWSYGGSYSRSAYRNNGNPESNNTAINGFRCVATLAGTVPKNTNLTTAAPTITNIAPTSAVVGTVVTITGTNLDKVTAVTFNGIAVKTITSNTATVLKVSVPEGATSGKLAVTTAGGTVTSMNDFAVNLGLKTNAKDNAGMLWVSGGTFTMGDAADVGYKRPAHQVTLTGYWIYKYDVTVAQYLSFCRATRRGLPKWPGNIDGWEGKTGWDDPALQQHPKVNVSWNDAKAYADWAGVSLPTEAQWEYAARGPQGSNYPWGGIATKDDKYNGWDMTKCSNYNNSSRGYKVSTWPVGSFPAGASWCGAQDMVGNAWQWCSDIFGDYDTAAITDPIGPATGRDRVLRGGSWVDTFDYYRSSERISNRPNDFANSIGFRCVLNLASAMPAITNTSPTITAIAPPSAIVGTVITITGAN